jgi:hypothetical protein
MNSIKLNDDLFFSIEREEKRMRLIVSNSNEVLVCHKVNRNELKKFVRATTSHLLFKGRLPLDKKDAHIFVNIKGNVVGEVNRSEFEELANQSYQPEQIPQS